MAHLLGDDAKDAAEGNADLIRRGQESPNEGHRFFFRESFGSSRFEVTKGALSTKIQALLNSEAFLRLLAQPESTFDLEEALTRTSHRIDRKPFLSPGAWLDDGVRLA